MIAPASAAQLAAVLADANARGESVHLHGALSKPRAGGPIADGLAVSTVNLKRVLQYEPNDLTISVEAGLPWSELHALLASNHQILPLDPPFAAQSTTGGVIAANLSGPRRRAFGTARDLVIGMEFVTMDGRTIRSGGTVVKNVAGLDMAKLMIGSCGTLAAITVVNFKLTPAPETTATFLARFDTVDLAAAARDAILRGVLQPAAIDLLNPAAAQSIGCGARWTLAIQAQGSSAVVARYGKELAGHEQVQGDAEAKFWQNVREFVPAQLAADPGMAAVRVATPLTALPVAGALTSAPTVFRAGNGVSYTCCPGPEAESLARRAATAGFAAVVEFRPLEDAIEQWPKPGDDLNTMKKVKDLFDPKGLLNRGRLYGRI